MSTVSLTVPKGRESCILWLKKSPPAVIADVLESMEHIYSTAHDVAESTAASREVRQLRSDLEKLLEHRERLCKDYEERQAQSIATCDALRAELQALKGARAIEHAKMREEYEARVNEVRTILRENYKEHFGVRREQSLLSTPNIKTLHDGMEIGVLKTMTTSEGAQQQEYVWTYTPREGRRLQGLVHVNGLVVAEEAEERFRASVAEGAASGRINLGLYICLAHRIAGIPHVAIELMHGVPVMKVSRSAEDAIGADVLVTMAFRSLAHLWPQLAAVAAPAAAAAASASATAPMHDLCDFVRRQFTEVKRLDATITGLDEASRLIQTQLLALRASRDKLFEHTTVFKKRHIPDEMVETIPTALEGAVGIALATAIRAYHTAKKRSPRGIDDLAELLSTDVLQEVKNHPGLYDRARERVIQENYAAGARARKRVKEGDGKSE